MQEMINNYSFRKRAGKQANLLITKYQPNIIFDKWEDLFLKLSKLNKK